MPSTTLALVVNPHAQGGTLGRVARSFSSELPRTASFHAPSTLDALGDAAREIRARGTHLVAIAGGDGTVHRVVSALHRVYGDEPLPMIALVRGGTMNTIANSIGVPRRRMAALLTRALSVDPSRSDRGVVRPTMRCEGQLGFLFGVGVVPAFLEAYYATGKPSPVTAARVLGTALAQSRTNGAVWRAMTGGIEAGLELDEGGSFPPSRVLAIAAGTIDGIGLGFRPFHRANETSDAMHLVKVDTDASGFVRELPRIRLARPMTASGGTDHLTRGFTVSTSATTLQYMLDGDVYQHPSGTLRVTLGPRVRFARLAT